MNNKQKTIKCHPDSNRYYKTDNVTNQELKATTKTTSQYMKEYPENPGFCRKNFKVCLISKSDIRKAMHIYHVWHLTYFMGTHIEASLVYVGFV